MTNLQEAMLALGISDLTPEFIEQLVHQRMRESLTLEYKEKLTPRILETIAAMANSYGGLILVGVSNDYRIVGVSPDSEIVLVNQCQALLEPPSTPEMALVHAVGDADRTILAIRVDTRRMPTPVVLNGKVWIRLQGKNAPADRTRLFSLFTAPSQESGLHLPTGTYQGWRPSTAYGPPRFHEEECFVVRSVLRAQGSMHQILPPIDTALRADLQERLAGSLLAHWRSNRIKIAGRHLDPTWIPQGANTSDLATLLLERPDNDGYVPLLRGILHLAQGAHGGAAVLLVEAVFYRDKGAQALRLDELIELCTFVIGDLTNGIGPPLLKDLLGTGLWTEAFTETRLETSNGTLLEWIDLSQLHRLPEGYDPSASNPLVLSGSDLAPGRAVRPYVVDWIKRLLLDAGFTHFEDMLEKWRLG